jgi:hypothetical protein
MPQLAGRQDAVAAQLRDHGQLGPQLRDGIPPPVGVEVADEVVGVRADGVRHHARACGGLELR